MDAERTPTGEEASERITAASAIFGDHATMSLAVCAGDEPWIGTVYFVDDEPAAGKLDLCCAVVASPLLGSDATVAFVVSGDEPDRWIQGVGTTEAVEDEADAAAVIKRLEERTPHAGRFLHRVEAHPIRIHVSRLRVTDLAADPPIAEFTFA